MLDSLSEKVVDETSARYDGWRIVAVCFLVATFGWGFGFYGQSVYVAELHRLHGWPASLISGGTTFFYLFGALLVAFVSEAIHGFGPRSCLVAGVLALAAAAALIGQFTEPWQLYAADAQPDHGDQPGDLCVRSGDRRFAARCVRKLFAAVLRLHQA
jgi:hypothetical protein